MKNKAVIFFSVGVFLFISYCFFLIVRISPMNDAPGNLLNLVVNCEAGKYDFKTGFWPLQSLVSCIYRDVKREKIFNIEYMRQGNEKDIVGVITVYSQFTPYFGCSHPLWFMVEKPEDAKYCKYAYRAALKWLLENDERGILTEAFKYYAGECNVFYLALDADDPELFLDLMNKGGDPFRGEENYCHYFNEQNNIGLDDTRSPGNLLVDGLIYNDDEKWKEVLALLVVAVN